MISKRSGSHMSDKQMAHAAVNNNLLHFNFSFGVIISGYLSGMDSFHWMIITKDGGTLLIHKSRVDFVEITDSKLANEDADIIEKVTKVAEPFWKFCERVFFGKTEE